VTNRKTIDISKECVCLIGLDKRMRPNQYVCGTIFIEFPSFVEL
jgi:hypothetical protein